MDDFIYCRPPNLGDLEEIIHINRVSLPENYPVGYFVQLIKDWHESSVVGIYNNQLVGYVITRIENFSFTGFLSGRFPKSHVISVAVLPEFRGKGIGKKMMIEVIKKVNVDGKLKEMTLEVRRSNVPAISMYEKMHFSKTKILDNYYRDGEGAYLMTLDMTLPEIQQHISNLMIEGNSEHTED